MVALKHPPANSKQFFRAKDQHMWDLGPGGIAPLGDILLQAGVGVAVPCTIALVIQPRWLHRADEIFTWRGAPSFRCGFR